MESKVKISRERAFYVIAFLFFKDCYNLHEAFMIITDPKTGVKALSKSCD